MTYTFKRIEELGWAGAVAAGLAFAQVLIYLDPNKVTDWKTWAIATAGALVRVFFGAVIAAKAGTLTPPAPPSTNPPSA